MAKEPTAYGLVIDAVNALNEAADLLKTADLEDAALNAVEKAVEAAERAASVIDAVEHPREKYEDDGRDYGHPGDFMKGLE